MTRKTRRRESRSSTPDHFHRNKCLKTAIQRHLQSQPKKTVRNLDEWVFELAHWSCRVGVASERWMGFGSVGTFRGWLVQISVGIAKSPRRLSGEPCSYAAVVSAGMAAISVWGIGMIFPTQSIGVGFSLGALQVLVPQ